MSREFCCEDCSDLVLDYSANQDRKRCYLCQWVRDAEPEPAKRAALRRELDRE